VADAEPEHEQRQQHDLRHGVAEEEQGTHGLVETARNAGGQTERGAGERTEGEAGQRARQARADVGVQLARGERAEKVPEDLARPEDVVGKPGHPGALPQCQDEQQRHRLGEAGRSRDRASRRHQSYLFGMSGRHARSTSDTMGRPHPGKTTVLAQRILAQCLPLPTPMRWKRRKTASPPQSTAIITEGSELDGTSSFTGTVILNGRAKGDVRATGTLTGGEMAVLQAQSAAPVGGIAGQAVGNVVATERVELRASARVVGDLGTRVCVIEAGAILEGRTTRPAGERAERQRAASSEEGATSAVS